MNIPFYPSPEVKKFGEELSESIFNAQLEKTLNGLGGSRVFDWTNYPDAHHLYIKKYFEDELDSIAVIYAGMRAKELQCG